MNTEDRNANTFLQKPFRPMLAYTYEASQKLTFPKLMSPKIDGIRGLIVNGTVRSRSFRFIPNRQVQAMFGHSKYNGLDGEFALGAINNPNTYRNTVSYISSFDREGDIEFHVFDDFTDVNVPFYKRLLSAHNKCSGAVKYLDHTEVNSFDEFESYEKKMIDLNYEGVIGRDPEGLYKYGRATEIEQSLFKVKAFIDDEAEVLDIIQYHKNDNPQVLNPLGYLERSKKLSNLSPEEKVGALMCVNSNGIVFTVGAGLTDKERIDYWRNPSLILGKTIKYKCQKYTDYDKPRQPVYLGLRLSIDR